MKKILIVATDHATASIWAIEKGLHMNFNAAHVASQTDVIKHLVGSKVIVLPEKLTPEMNTVVQTMKTRNCHFLTREEADNYIVNELLVNEVPISSDTKSKIQQARKTPTAPSMKRKKA